MKVKKEDAAVQPTVDVVVTDIGEMYFYARELKSFDAEGVATKNLVLEAKYFMVNQDNRVVDEQKIELEFAEDDMAALNKLLKKIRALGVSEFVE